MAGTRPTRNGAPEDFTDIEPSDSALLQGYQWLKIGVAGDLCLKGAAEGAVACTPFPVAEGEYVPFGAGFVMDTGTSASGIVGFS